VLACWSVDADVFSGPFTQAYDTASTPRLVRIILESTVLLAEVDRP